MSGLGVAPNVLPDVAPQPDPQEVSEVAPP